ncbi:MAG TPA: acetaldehyde dehydrogenase (acetylating) [Elusimicrobiota bacterium]|nr:acetaldehyde dehydrogenase (acetylating) [Elusimicrobiota bacterium]
MKKLKVAIIGSGNIGTDLLIKVMRSPHLECGAFIGRNLSSPGMAKATAMGMNVSSESISYIESNPDCCELVFDATSAVDHQRHAPILRKLGKISIDLTPAQVGQMCVPAVNMRECLSEDNVNMVTCGGQASIPVAYALAQSHSGIDYIEVVSSIASRSAGPATRRNLDEYIHTTENGLRKFSGCRRTKAILNLNPAQPCVNMQTTVMAKVSNPKLDEFTKIFQKIAQTIREYVPGYETVVPPTIENNRIFTMVRVRGLGDYLPAYAGNLDIINCAAIAMAEEYAKNRRPALTEAGAPK